MKKLIMGAAILAANGLAFGATVSAQSQQQVQVGTSTQQTSLQQLKDRCAELSEDIQQPHFDVTVQCSDLQFVWQPGAGTSVDIPNSREVGAIMRVKDNELPFTGIVVVKEPTQVECASFDLYRLETAPIAMNLTCEELYAIENIGDFCTPLIDENVAQDPGLVTIEKVEGESINLCAGFSQAQ